MFTKEIKSIIKMVLSAIIVSMAITGIFHCFTYESKIKEAFENGYQQAILDAELVSVEENEYVISFHGEEHIYSSSIGKEVMDESSENGYQKAIMDAELVESSDTGYTLSFNGEVSWYTFD